MNSRIFPTLLLLTSCLLLLVSCAESTETPVEPDPKPKLWDAPPPMTTELDKRYSATFQTELGNIVVELYAKGAPHTVNNFIFLAKEGFYDGTHFHRVIPGFMAQGGDPTNTGGGGPGYKFSDEFNSELRHDEAGILSMANAGPNTNGSQFFITYGPTPHLDDHHTVFGKVIEGMDVLLKLEVRDPSAQQSSPGTGLLTLTINQYEH